VRLLHVIVPEEFLTTAEELVGEAEAVELWTHSLAGGRALLVALVAKEKVEVLTDALKARLESTDGFYLVLLPVEATFPLHEDVNEEAEGNGDNNSSDRISREELYNDVKGAATLTPTFAALVVLSTVVAAFGLVRDNPAVIIGAMVMAPLLGPNMALSLAAALGDRSLASHALLCNVVGAGLTFVVAVGLGLGIDVDPGSKEVASRTVVGSIDIAIALAAGVAGCLAFTSGLSQSIVGVMVAVALLPPLVVCGLLLGAQEWASAYRAMLLVLVNIAAVNIAGVGTFLFKGIRPANWWEKDAARRASIFAGVSWAIVLALLGIALWLSAD